MSEAMRRKVTAFWLAFIINAMGLNQLTTISAFACACIVLGVMVTTVLLWEAA